MERMMVGKSPPGKLVAPGPPGNRVSPLKSTGDPSSRKHMEPGGVPGGEDGVQPQPADLDHRPVLEHEVVGRQHAPRRRR